MSRGRGSAESGRGGGMDSGGVLVRGIDMELLSDILRRSCPEKTISIERNSTNFRSPAEPSEVLLYDFSPETLINEIHAKELEIQQLELTARLTAESIQKFHQNQTELYNEFAILSSKYDDQKLSHVTTLWTHCVAHHPEVSVIPNEENSNFPETETQVGRYVIGDPLGDGQFATVFNCTTKLSQDEYALKVILKNKVTTFAALRRVANEIKILRKLKNPYVIHLVDVIHTKTKLYLVTEKGGKDLFDFFESHSDGVQEEWALDIVNRIAQAVQYCHVNSICHRDLKPENILIQFDESNGKCIDLKLCDFGLAVRSPPSDLLCDFCGSPGFFAPEMLLSPNYQGMKADVWSMGCIFLELLIGNELFWNHWMVSYDVEVLQDKNRFRTEIDTSTEELPSILNFSATLNTFLIAILQVNPEKRPTTQAIFEMDWLHDSVGETLPPELLVPTVTFGGEENTGTNNKLLLSSPSVSKNMLKTAVSNREKQRVSSAGGALTGGGEYPPPMFGGAEQQTPTITKARKIIQRGDEIHKNGTDRFSPVSSSSTNNLRDTQKPSI